MKTLLVGAFTLMALLPAQAYADWQLVKENSSLYFSSTKKEHIVEHHKFKQFDSHINADGQVSLTIELASVDTGIEIRDSRMKEFLFEVERFSQATFSATESVNKLLNSLQPGQVVHGTLTGELTLHGQTKPVTFDYILTYVSLDSFTVVSTAPMLIKANDFALIDGVKKLQELAGLPSIGQTVPVSVALQFNKI